MDVMLETFPLTMVKVTTLVTGERSDRHPIPKKISDDTTGRIMTVKSEDGSSVSEIKAQVSKVDFENSEKDIDNCPSGNKGSKSKSKKKMWRKVDLRSVFPQKPLSLEVIFGAEIAVECEKKQSVHLSYAAVTQKNTGAVWRSSRYQTKAAIQDRGIASRSEEHCSLPKNSFLTDDHYLFPKISYQPKDRCFLLPNNSYQTEDQWLFPGNRYKTEDHCSLPASSTLPEDRYLVPKKSYKTEDCCLVPKKHAKTKDNCLISKKHANTGDSSLIPKNDAKTEKKILLPKNDAKTKENFLLPKNDVIDDDNCSISEASFDCVIDNLLSKKSEEQYFLAENNYLTKYPSLYSKNCYPIEHQHVPPKDSHENDCCFFPKDISLIKNAYYALKKNYEVTTDYRLLPENSNACEDLSVLSMSDSFSEDLDFLPHYIYLSEDYCLILKYSYEKEDDLLIPRNMSKVEDEAVDENTSQIRDLPQKSPSDIFDLHHSHCYKEHNEKVNIPYTLTDMVNIIKSDTKLSTTETDDLAENIAINGLDLGTTAHLVSKLWGLGRKRMAYAENLGKEQKTSINKETVKEFNSHWKEELHRKWGITCNKSGCLH